MLGNNKLNGQSNSRAAGGFQRTTLSLALGLCGVIGPVLPAFAADNAAKLQAQVQLLIERMQNVEQRNSDLERQVKELTVQPAKSTPTSTAALERLERVERQNVALQQQLDELPAPETDSERTAPAFTANLLAVGQNANAGGAASGMRETRSNYRLDLTAELDAGTIGEAKGTVFAQVRLGQGTGLSLRPTYTSSVNTTGFQTAAGPDDSFGVLAQAYYQLEWPLSGSGFNESTADRVILNIGKMDVFALFDQNKVAADEGAQFMNNAFVHNPLLDSGGDTAADAYGFAPGVRLGYFSRSDSNWAWGASVGVFGSGSAGANFSGSLKQPLVIAQVEASHLQINGAPRANYRLYTWTNGGTSDLLGQQQTHSGVGVSIDHKIGRDWNLFGRAGYRTSGDAKFDSALTVGFEHGGKAWGRPNDALGFAVGLMRTGQAWRDATTGGTLTGYEASGNETVTELYYRIKLNEHLSLSPDAQYISLPGGDGNAPVVWAAGLRANIGF